MIKHERLVEIMDSYFNGNITWTRAQVKRMGKLDYGRLILMAEERGMDLEDFIYKVTV